MSVGTFVLWSTINGIYRADLRWHTRIWLRYHEQLIAQATWGFNSNT